MSNKRYIISFTEESTSQNIVAATLAVKSNRIKCGIKSLTTCESVDDDDIHIFEEFGVCTASITKKEVERLRKDKRVAEVTEDFEVFALGNDCCCQSKTGKSESPNIKSICPPNTRLELVCTPIAKPEPESPTEELQPLPWNIEMVNANRVWDRVTGQNVKVAILDTGIDEDHPDLSISGGVSLVPGVNSWNDDNGHGTHCAGIAGARNNPIGIVGVAPRCSLFAVKILDDNGSGQLSWILAGMGWAVSNNMQVVSMSLGSDVDSPDASCVVAYQRAAEKLVNNGSVVVAAAGNSGTTSKPWVGQPARCPGYMAVASVDSNKNLSSFSSRGPEDLCGDCGVEISAPGQSIKSTWPGGGYKTISGTSMACPHVSGAAALLKELHPTWSPSKIRKRLRDTAADLGSPGNDPEFGSGLLNCHAAVFGNS